MIVKLDNLYKIKYCLIYMDSFDMGENTGVMILQGVVMLLAIIIMFMLYSEKNKTIELQNKIDSFECPACPSIPECPDCNCGEGGKCPDCICENDGPPNLECPSCPACPEVKGPSVDDIVNAIFPGRNPGMTSHGRFFSYEDFTDEQLKSTFQSIDDMTANTMGSGIPSKVNYEDQILTNSNSDIGLASKVDPPMSAGSGVFSKPSSVIAPGGDETTPTSETSTTTNDASSTPTS